jgi:hypothetical protein
MESQSIQHEDENMIKNTKVSYLFSMANYKLKIGLIHAVKIRLVRMSLSPLGEKPVGL